MDFIALIIALSLATLRLSTPLIFTSMGGLFSERSGIINVALEGFILTGAFAGSVVAYYLASAWAGWFAALVAGFAIGGLFGLLVIKFKADQVVTGIAMNLLVMGLIPFLSKIIFDSTGSTPSLLVEDRFDFEPIVMALLLVMTVAWWLKKTRSGLWLQFAGEHPEALESSGVQVKNVRWVAVIIAGGLAALGGASLSLFLASSYSPLMSGGRGFMALAALIFGKWKPLPTLAACLFFGFADALQIRLQGVQINGLDVPVQLIQVLPYLITIITLAGFVGASRAPKYLGQKN